MNSKQLEVNLHDQLWRLNNLYHIIDKKGRHVLFTMNRAQRQFYKRRHYKNIILKARQLGMSTFLLIYMLDMCLFVPKTRCGLIAHTLDDAKGLLNTKFKYAYEHLPDDLRLALPQPKTMSKTLVEFDNDSAIVVGTSLRGGTYNILHISEFGKISARNPDKAREIVTGALNTQAPDQYAFIESTAEGQSGRFYKMVQRARSLENLSENDEEEMTEMDWKFHFFPWFDDPAYILNPSKVQLLPEHHKYFEELEHEQGIVLSAEQKAWWVKKSDEQQEEMSREFPTHPDEAFAASIEGAYWAKQMFAAEKDGRITNVPYNRLYPVETWWDLGMADYTAVFFAQRMPTGAIHIIDYYEANGLNLSDYAAMLDRKGYKYSRHIGPHDIRNRDLSATDGKTRQQIMEGLGVRPWDLAAKVSLQEGIQIARSMIDLCYFDKTKCEGAIKHLKSYVKKWDKVNGMFLPEPKHDEHSHCADAFRMGALAPEDSSSTGFERSIVPPNFGAV